MNGILLSGGMDSIALAYWKRPQVAFNIDYGQRAAHSEAKAAQQIAEELGMEFEHIRIDCSSLGSGDMSGGQPLGLAPVSEWWPYRNQLLATLAGMRAVALGVVELMTGSVAADGKHADGRPEFYSSLDALMRLQEGGLRVSAPALGMSTTELVRISGIPRESLAWAHSCHLGDLACGECHGCLKHYHVTHELYGEGY